MIYNFRVYSKKLKTTPLRRMVENQDLLDTPSNLPQSYLERQKSLFKDLPPKIWLFAGFMIVASNVAIVYEAAKRNHSVLRYWLGLIASRILIVMGCEIFFAARAYHQNSEHMWGSIAEDFYLLFAAVTLAEFATLMVLRETSRDIIQHVQRLLSCTSSNS